MSCCIIIDEASDRGILVCRRAEYRNGGRLQVMKLPLAASKAGPFYKTVSTVFPGKGVEQIYQDQFFRRFSLRQ